MSCVVVLVAPVALRNEVRGAGVSVAVHGASREGLAVGGSKFLP